MTHGAGQACRRCSNERLECEFVLSAPSHVKYQHTLRVLIAEGTWHWTGVGVFDLVAYLPHRAIMNEPESWEVAAR